MADLHMPAVVWSIFVESSARRRHLLIETLLGPLHPVESTPEVVAIVANLSDIRKNESPGTGYLEPRTVLVSGHEEFLPFTVLSWH